MDKVKLLVEAYPARSLPSALQGHPPAPIRPEDLGPGRALLIDQQGRWYAGRGREIVASSNKGATWTVAAWLPPTLSTVAGARWPLLGRLLRQYFAGLVRLADGTLVAIARSGIHRATPEGPEFSLRFPITRGSRPLNLREDARGRVLFGEYGSGLEREEVRVYVSDDGARHFEVAYSFPRGAIRHVHNVIPERDGSYWVLCGDYKGQPGIANLSADFRHLEWLSRGSQLVRAVDVCLLDDALVYGTDSDHAENFIVRLDKQSGVVTVLRRAEGSSLYATRFGSTWAIATCVEPNAVAPSRASALYISRDAASWQRDIGPQVKAFLSSNTGRNDRYLLHLDAHTSIALLAGHVLDMKSGVDIALVQRGAGKTAIWEFVPVPPPSSPVVTTRLEAVHDGATDVAVALSVSNDTAPEVIEYAKEKLPSVGRVLAASL